MLRGKRRRERQRVPDQSRARTLRFETADLAAAADEAVVRANLMVADLAGAGAAADEQPAARDDAAADPGPERQQHEVRRRPCRRRTCARPSVAQRASLPTNTGSLNASRMCSPSATSFQPKLGE